MAELKLESDDVSIVTSPDPDESQNVRVISIYATAWRHRVSRSAPARGPEKMLEERLPLGRRLEEFHYLFRDQLPRILDDRSVDVSEVDLVIESDPDQPDAAPASHPHPGERALDSVQAWLFCLASDQVVLALDVEFSSPPLDIDSQLMIDILEHCAFAQLTVGGATIGEYAATWAEECGCKPLEEDVSLPSETYRRQLPPERHQIVFAAPNEGRAPLSESQLEAILYRVDPPFRPEFIDIKAPLGLNPSGQPRRGLVTPYTSLLIGHHEYIENTVFLTTVQAVGTAARFRQIWHRAYTLVRDFRQDKQAENVGEQHRSGMEELADELGNLELELSFSVETSSDLGLLIPTLRSVSFQRELYEALELHERSARVSQLFTRLDASIRSELTAIDIRDTTAGDRRRRRWTLAVNILTTFVVPIGFLLSYFGVGTGDATESMFHFGHYRMVYLAALALALLPLVTWGLATVFSQYVERRAARSITPNAPNAVPGERIAATVIGGLDDRPGRS